MARGLREFAKRICLACCPVSVAAVLMLGGEAAADSVVLQGFQVQDERYAANTADAYVYALQTQPGQVTALRPKSQPGWAGGESYSSKTELLSRLRALAGGTSGLTLVLVGDADGPGGSFRVGEEAGATAAEIADALAGAAGVSLVSAGCNAMAEAVASRLTSAAIAVSAITRAESAHTWPKGNRAQFDLYSRSLISHFYLLSGQRPTAAVSELLARAHRAARREMIKLSGGRQQPTRLSGSAVSSTGRAVVALGSRDYGIYLQLLGDGNVSGYVADALGLPISPIQSARRVSDVVSFSFTERGRSVEVTARDLDGVPGVTLDGSAANFTYQTRRADLVSAGKHLGAAFVVSGLSGSPRVMVALESGKPATELSFDSAGQSISFQVADNDRMRDVSLTFGPLGDIQVSAGDTPYSASNVLRYGLYGADGNLVASIVGVRTDDQVKGELLPANSEMRLPLTASLGKEGLTGSASLVGNTFTLTGGSAWSATRPPAEGRLQSHYFDLPTVRDVYADATSPTGRVDVTWDIETAGMSTALLLGDLRFQVVRTDRFNNVATAFDVPAGRKRYTDQPDGDSKAFDYAVRPVLDHRVTTCSAMANLPIVGPTVPARSGAPAEMKAPRLTAAVASPTIETQPVVVAEAPVKQTEQLARKQKEIEEKAREAEKKRREEAEKQKEKDEEGLRKIREMREGEGWKGKIVYGVLGVFILIGLAIAVGGGGAPSNLEPP